MSSTESEVEIFHDEGEIHDSHTGSAVENPDGTQGEDVYPPRNLEILSDFKKNVDKIFLRYVEAMRSVESDGIEILSAMEADLEERIMRGKLLRAHKNEISLNIKRFISSIPNDFECGIGAVPTDGDPGFE